MALKKVFLCGGANKFLNIVERQSERVSKATVVERKKKPKWSKSIFHEEHLSKISLWLVQIAICLDKKKKRNQFDTQKGKYQNWNSTEHRMGKLQYLQDIHSNNTQDSYESFMLIQLVICRTVHLSFKSMKSGI